MIEALVNHALQIVLTVLGAGGLALILRWTADKYGQPVVQVVGDKIDRYLQQPQNQWKLTTLRHVYGALDPLLPDLLPQYGAEKVETVVRLLVQTYSDRTIPDEAIDEMVALYRQAFDPLRQNLHPSPLSNALGEAISAYQARNPEGGLLGTVEDLIGFMPKV